MSRTDDTLTSNFRARALDAGASQRAVCSYSSAMRMLQDRHAVRGQLGAVPLLQKQLAGELTWADLWQPHNEHRLFVPWAIWSALRRFTAWNDTYEIALSVLAAGSRAVCCYGSGTEPRAASLSTATR